MSRIAVAAYAGVGFFLISFTHSYYCAYFHQGEKRFGLPFVESGIWTEFRHGYVGAGLLGVLSFSLFLNFLTVSFSDFPESVTGPEPGWFGALLLLGVFLLFVASPILGGPAAIKWVLEGSLFLFVFLLILSIPASESTFDQVQFVFSVSGAVLASIYLFWIRIYILGSDTVEPDTLRDVLGTFDNQTGNVWALWGTVVYFAFSGVYILVGYLYVFVLLNA